MPACPSCGYENADDALCCGLCQVVLRREKGLGEAEVKALLKQVFDLGKEAARKGDAQALRDALPALASRLFLEVSPQRCRALVLEPTASAWLQLVAPAILGAEKHAAIKGLLARMCESAQAGRLAEAFEHLRAADQAAGKHGRMELLILGLGLKRALEKTQPRPPAAPETVAPPPAPARAAPLRRGDVLGGDFEIHGVLGEGGFGVVYLAYHRPSGTAMALKTFRDEVFHDAAARALFLREAQTLVDLDPHPNLVRTYLVRELQGRLFLGLEFVAPGPDAPNTLAGRLERQPPDLAQTLRWGVEFCHGMEFAQSRGVRCHRDVKPANLMVDQGGRLMISDFGLARAAGAPDPQRGLVMGTPTHMAPEQFLGAERCDHRTDIYSFGVVLYQLASGGRLPFPGRSWEELRALHSEGEPPPLGSAPWPVIARCLAKDPGARFQSFRLLREALAALLEKETGRSVPAPEPKRREWYEWDAKGGSLMALGRHAEALSCFEKALALEPTAQSLNNMGLALLRLGRADEALSCVEKALALEDAGRAWANKAAVLVRLGRLPEALAAAEAAIARAPGSCGGWTNKATVLQSLGRGEEAEAASRRAVEVDPGSPQAWQTRGAVLQGLSRFEEAAAAADKALSLDPALAAGWTNKGYALSALGRQEEALACFREAAERDPRLVQAWAGARQACLALGRAEEASRALDQELELDPTHGPSWLDKGVEHEKAGRLEESLSCMEKAVRFEPRWPFAFVSRGRILDKLGRVAEAEADFARALEMKPDYAEAAYCRGLALRRLGRPEEALGAFEAALSTGRSLNAALEFSAWYCRAETLQRLGRFPEADACYAKALELCPPAARPAVEAARRSCALGQPPA